MCRRTAGTPPTPRARARHITSLHILVSSSCRGDGATGSSRRWRGGGHWREPMERADLASAAARLCGGGHETRPGSATSSPGAPRDRSYPSAESSRANSCARGELGAPHRQSRLRNYYLTKGRRTAPAAAKISAGRQHPRGSRSPPQKGGCRAPPHELPADRGIQESHRASTDCRQGQP